LLILAMTLEVIKEAKAEKAKKAAENQANETKK
jgi:hypothetical protein